MPDELILYDRERDGEMTDDIWINILEVARKTQRMNEEVMEA